MNRTYLHRHASALAAVVGVVLLAYAASLTNGFVWDDAPIIVDNEAAHHLTSLAELFTAEDVAFTDEDNPYFRPVPRVLFVLEYALYGDHPLGYHLDSVVCHATAALLLYALLIALFASRRLALGATLLFALHPVNVEAVAFISTRNTILAALFLLAALLGHQRWLATGRVRLLVGVALLAFVAFASKETALTLPLLLPVAAAYGPDAGAPRWRRVAAGEAAVAVAVVLYLGLRANALAGGHLDLALATLPERLRADLYIVPRYVENLLLPVRLSGLYGVPHPPFGVVGLGVAVWAVLVASATLLVRLGGAAAFGLFWFALNLLPVANLVPIPSAPLADRYLYLPGIGVLVVAADLFWRATARCATAAGRRGVGAAGAVLLLLLGVATVARTRVWRDDLALFTSMAQAGERPGYAYFNLGLAYRARGDLAAARTAWERAVAAEPNHPLALTQLGNVAQVDGDWGAAIAYYRRALAVAPDLPEALFNGGLALEHQGEVAAARELFARFVAVAPARYGEAREAARARLGGTAGLPPKERP